mmetsp:Transcript_13440/g.27426  ORF Transcript_13440/g.27426 Transcript_13440/m.27426 type:complete len:162 (+) Transcript_13440:176-661(+)
MESETSSVTALDRGGGWMEFERDEHRPSPALEEACGLDAPVEVMIRVVAGRRDRSRKKEPVIPGQTRYWTPGEHRKFLQAIKTFGHKDLRAISEFVGTRNVTQVRTHTQKFFMRILREAKRHKEEASKASAQPYPDQVIRSVPEDCGVSLLSLVAQETAAP